MAFQQQRQDARVLRHLRFAALHDAGSDATDVLPLLRAACLNDLLSSGVARTESCQLRGIAVSEPQQVGIACRAMRLVVPEREEPGALEHESVRVLRVPEAK
jgi:hypothetical protein